MSEKLKKALQAIALATLLLGMALPATAGSSLEGDMNSFFGDLNYANVTPAGEYQGQGASYYTGGSVFLRVPSRSYTLGSIQFPSFRAGCGGIDLFAGGFSFINKEQLVAMLRNIGSAAVSYAFMVGMRSLSPQLTATLEKLQDWAQKFNNFQIDSCESGAQLVGGALSMFSKEKGECITAKTKGGSNYADALLACTSGGERNSTLNNKDPNAAGNAINATKGNIAWRALMKNGFFQTNTDIAQVMMNLSGTVVTYKDSGGEDALTVSNTLPSILTDNRGTQLLNALLRGGSVPIKGCADGKGEMECLQVTSNLTIAITESNGLVKKVETILTAINNNIMGDTKLTAEQQGLLAATSLPVFKYLTVQAALLPSSASNEITQYATLIAKDILATYLSDLLGKMVAASALLKANEKDDDKLAQFKQGLLDARSEVRRYKDDVVKAFDESLAFTERTQQQEKQIITRLSPSIFKSVMFGTN